MMQGAIRTALVTAAVLLLLTIISGVAKASETTIVLKQVPWWYGLDGPTHRILKTDPRHFDAEREARWKTRCSPRTVVDRYGVSRYVYNGKAGCEFGRAED